MTNEDIEPMHPAAKKFLECVFADVTIEGVTRHLEFIEGCNGDTMVILHAPNNMAPPVMLGFPAEWWPPADEDWDEALREEVERDELLRPTTSIETCDWVGCNEPTECKIGTPCTAWCAKHYEEIHLQGQM